MRRPLAALTLLLVVLATGTAGAQGQAQVEPRASLPDIEDEVMCTVCGTTLQLSTSPQATRERTFINGLIADGLDKEQIKDELVAEYGADVLAVPSTSGFDLTAWLIPIVGFLVAAFGIALAARRWRGERTASPAPTGSAAADIDPGDDERLRADLRRYEH